jgi:uncharacterized protein with HEPN domain
MKKHKPKPNAFVRVMHILDSIDKIDRFITNFDYEAFTKDEKTIAAVVRQIEIIGEATYHIPKEWKEKYPQITWQDIEGMRHKIVHDYYEIRLDVVWTVATVFARQYKIDLQPLKEELELIENTQLE